MQRQLRTARLNGVGITTAAKNARDLAGLLPEVGPADQVSAAVGEPGRGAFVNSTSPTCPGHAHVSGVEFTARAK